MIFKFIIKDQNVYKSFHGSYYFFEVFETKNYLLLIVSKNLKLEVFYFKKTKQLIVVCNIKYLPKITLY